MTIIFNHGYPPKSSVLYFRGIAGGLVSDRFGQLYFENDEETVKFAEKHKLRYWVFGQLTPEEERTGSYRINHFERYLRHKEIEEMADREEV